MSYHSDPAPFMLDTAGVKEFYIDGFQSGLEWKVDNPHWQHTPGGPHVASEKHAQGGPWKEYCDRTARRHQAWMLGWKHGAMELGFKLAHAMPDPSMTQQELDSILAHIIRSGHPMTLTMASHMVKPKASPPAPSPLEKAMLQEIQLLEIRTAMLKKIIKGG